MAWWLWRRLYAGIDGALQVTVTFDDMRRSVGLVDVEFRVLLTSALRARLAFWHALVEM
jgi:hypothetical protein